MRRADTLLASAAATATRTSNEVITGDDVGILFFLDVTATPNNTETLTFIFEGKDYLTGKYVPIYQSFGNLSSTLGAAPTTATYLYEIRLGTDAPAAASAPGYYGVSRQPPATGRVRVVPSGATSWTYSVTYQTIP